MRWFWVDVTTKPPWNLRASWQLLILQLKKQETWYLSILTLTNIIEWKSEPTFCIPMLTINIILLRKRVIHLTESRWPNEYDQNRWTWPKNWQWWMLMCELDQKYYHNNENERVNMTEILYTYFSVIFNCSCLSL